MDWLAGKSLADRLKEVQDQVRRTPAEPRHRVFLFQLLAVLGQWERALNQLQVIGELDASALPMVQTYGQALRLEPLREAVCAGRRTPLIFGEPESWIALCLEALRLGGQGEGERAKAIRAQAFEDAPATPGTLGPPQSEPFAWIADGDERFGPLLEALIDGKYYWVPFHRIGRLVIEPPQDLRDLVWMPAHFRWVNGGESAGLIPTRYPGSQDQEDDRFRLGTRTEWSQGEDGAYRGLGQRLLVTDRGEYALMDLRELTFGAPPDRTPDTD